MPSSKTLRSLPRSGVLFILSVCKPTHSIQSSIQCNWSCTGNFVQTTFLKLTEGSVSFLNIVVKTANILSVLTVQWNLIGVIFLQPETLLSGPRGLNISTLKCPTVQGSLQCTDWQLICCIGVIYRIIRRLWLCSVHTVQCTVYMALYNIWLGNLCSASCFEKGH